MDLGSWILDPDPGSRILDPGSCCGSWRLGARILDPGSWILAGTQGAKTRRGRTGPLCEVQFFPCGFWAGLDPGPRILDPGSWSPGSWILDPGSCYGPWELGTWILDPGFGILAGTQGAKTCGGRTGPLCEVQFFLCGSWEGPDPGSWILDPGYLDGVRRTHGNQRGP